MPVIVPFMDDSISHALFCESLKNSLVLEFHFNVNGMEMIQYKNTQMKWKGVEENSRRAPAGRAVPL